MIADSPPNAAPRGLIWLVVLIVFLLLLLAIWLTLNMGFFQRSNVGSLVSVAPMPGGAVIPTNTPISLVSPDSMVLGSSDFTVQNALPLVPNETVIIANQATSGSANPMPLFTDPSVNSRILGSYSAGTLLTIIEAGSGYPNYPVEVDGVSWVRVSDGRGIFGWTKTDMLQRVSVVEANQPVQLLIDQVQPQDPEAGTAEPIQEQPAGQEPEPALTSTPAG